jgi:type II secretory pathway pseudopilin PulG
MTARRPAPRDEGSTLLEVVIAVAIMGITLPAILGGIGTSILMSGVHRQQAAAGGAVRAYAEAVQNVVAEGGYVPCATTSSYATPAGFTAPSGYTATVVANSMRYWNGTAWQTTCGTDSGIQRLTLEVAGADTRAGSERLIIVVRKPCGTRTGEALCT